MKAILFQMLGCHKWIQLEVLVNWLKKRLNEALERSLSTVYVLPHSTCDL